MTSRTSSLKADARKQVADAVADLSQTHPKLGLFVRPNSLATRLTGYDLEATVGPGLTGVFAPKIDHPFDMIRYDALVDFFERNGGSGVEYIVPVETVHGIQNCAAIAAASPRVGAMIGPTAEHADIAKAVGYEWTMGGLESLYHRTRILLACRATDVYPFTALWERIADLEGLREFATQGRGMGFRGMVVLHPSHVPIINDVFTPTAEDIDFYRSTVEAYDGAAQRGNGAVLFGRDPHRQGACRQGARVAGARGQHPGAARHVDLTYHDHPHCRNAHPGQRPGLRRRRQRVPREARRSSDRRFPSTCPTSSRPPWRIPNDGIDARAPAL
jgi:citrate lyase subunit beta/citryl-CoA lyase